MKKIVVVLLVVMAMGVSSVYAAKSTITVTGIQSRVDLVEKYFVAKSITINKQYTNEVMGTFKSRPWPGVNVSSEVPGEDGIFVPISDKALVKGLCADQQKLLLSFVPAVTAPVVKEMITVTPSVKKTTSVVTMRVCVDGTGCDEREFTGSIPSATLEATDGKTIDILEVHQRSDKTPQFKVKRLRVLTNGIAYPLQWVDSGACVRAYQSEIFSQAQMGTLLLPGETLEQLKSDDGFFTDAGGAHNTIAVYLIHHDVDFVKSTSSVKTTTQPQVGSPRVFTMELPVAQLLLTNVK